MKRLPKAKIELEKMLRANAEQQKPVKRTAKPKTTAKNAMTPMGIRENQLLPSDAWTIVLNGDAGAWAKSLGGLFRLHEAVNAAENLELFAGLLDAEHTIDGICKILADNFFDGDIEEGLMRMWYPDGTVTSREQWSTDLKYDWTNADETSHTVKVLPFCNMGDSSADNSDKTGIVVIPPYVTDTNGVRYAVVGMRDGEMPDVNTNLTSIVAPTTVTNIGYYAFNNCTTLTSVSFPAAEGIAHGTFYMCTSLTFASLPAATSIGEDVFYDCTSLNSVSFPAATSIGNGAFNMCTSLASVSLPAATDIGYSAFSNCDALATLDLSSLKRSIIEENLDVWGIYLSSGQTITITASDETFTITGE